MYGSHLSVAGGPHRALEAAVELGLDCVQIFTANQRQWRSGPVADDVVARWAEARDATAIHAAVSHASYLINLASPDDALWSRSIDAFAVEIERCAQLGVGDVVIHPGAHTGSGETAGLARIARALDVLEPRIADWPVRICLEVTAGQGTTLGAEFEHLAEIIALVRHPQRLGVCLDTAHLLAAGHPLDSGAGARKTLAACDRVLGLDRVRVIHVNDSKTPRGSRVDRHEHIGHGHVSPEAFGVLLRKRAFASTPKILETPKEADDSGRPWDAVNLAQLKSLCRPARGKSR